MEVLKISENRYLPPFYQAGLENAHWLQLFHQCHREGAQHIRVIWVMHREGVANVYLGKGSVRPPALERVLLKRISYRMIERRPLITSSLGIDFPVVL
jgi:hypothetical protein